MADARKIDVGVVLDLGSTPPFHLECKSMPMGSKGHLTFKNNKHPGFVIHYTIRDPNHGYLFPDQGIANHLQEALYSALGTECPESPGQWDQFTATAVTNQGRTLIVRNLNKEGEHNDFSYTLRVTNDGGGTYLNLDPGGTNDDGSYGFDWSSVINVTLAIGAVAAAVVALTETLHITNFFR